MGGSEGAVDASVLVSPVVAVGVGTGPGLLGSATVVPLRVTESAAIASPPVTPAVAEINFTFEVFTNDSIRFDAKLEGMCFTPFAARLTEGSGGQTCDAAYCGLESGA